MREVAFAAGAMLACGLASADSYRVYPVESPNHGPRQLLTDPADPVASPFGWHDTDGAPGAEFNYLNGNNAYAFTDIDANGVPDPGSSPSDPLRLFDFAIDLAAPPSSSFPAHVTNAFYWTNRLHDIFFRHGFTPARGNMQANTYGFGGIGNDPVRVEVAWGGGTNNVNYVARPDGQSPSIRHYIWTAPTPDRESSLDAGATTWAYTLLMYNRLTTGCTPPTESPHIGFADFLGVLVTTDFHTATPTTPRGFGTWLLEQPITGAGIRGLPYTTDLTVFNRTYAMLPTLQAPHLTGSVFAAALWDLTWAMVARYGASHDLLAGTGAENRVLRLAIDGMDLMACPGGFVSARDGILAADQSLHAGQDRCLIWAAFARRGIGFGASEGLSTSISDQTPSFLIPPDCDLLFANGFD